MMLIAIKSNQTKSNNLLAHYFSSVLHFVLHSESQLKAKYKNKID